MPKIHPETGNKSTADHRAIVTRYITSVTLNNSSVFTAGKYKNKKQLEELAKTLNDKTLETQVIEFINTAENVAWVMDFEDDIETLKVQQYLMAYQLCNAYFELHPKSETAKQMLEKVSDSISTLNPLNTNKSGCLCTAL
jgi:molybdenum cofactor biosynthesis enzyme MoaA